MIKILTDSYTFPSAKVLRDSLEELSGEKILVTSNPDKIKEDTKLIRYGSSAIVNGALETGYNSPDLISVASSKFRFSNLMSTKDIYSPVYTKVVPEEFPVMIRESLTSSGGKGIHVVNSLEDFNNVWRSHFYWTKFIFLQFELRVHVINGKIKRIFKKEEREQMEFPIRNNSVCDFKLKNLEHYSKLQDFVTQLCEIPPLDKGFFGADIGWDSNNKKYFVIEINSAPGLNENTGMEYAEEIWESIK